MSNDIIYHQGVVVTDLRVEALTFATKLNELSTEIILKAAGLFLEFLRGSGYRPKEALEALSKAIDTSDYQESPAAVVARAKAFYAFLRDI